MAKRRASWRDTAREKIAALVVEQFKGISDISVISKEELERQFRALARVSYPWQRHGQAYTMWLSETAIAVEYAELVRQGQRKPENFKAYSIAKFKNRTCRRKVDVVVPGQLGLL